jgi:uncharacterized protein YgfB (UPF0149 family)
MSRDEYDSDEEWFQDHVQSYEGALIAGNDGEQWFHYLSDNSGDGIVLYVPGSVGSAVEYTYDELQSAIESEEVVLATSHDESEYFDTPDGRKNY